MNFIFLNTNGHGHILAFVLDVSDSVFLSSFPLKTARLIKTKLHVELLLNWEMEVYSWDLGHMIKMAAIPIYDTNF